MMILVRALIANDNKGHEIYKMTGKIFSMGTPVEKIADYVESLITERLNSLEIKIIKSTDGLINGIDEGGYLIPNEGAGKEFLDSIETSGEPKKPTEGKITEVKWQGEDFF